MRFIRFGSTVPLLLPPPFIFSFFFFFLRLHPAPRWRPSVFPLRHVLKGQFHNCIIYLSRPSRSLPISGQTSSPAPWDIPASSFPPAAPLLCPYMSTALCSHRKRQQICYCCRGHQHLWHRLGGDVKSKHRSLSDDGSVQATRKPQKKGNPRLCSA